MAKADSSTITSVYMDLAQWHEVQGNPRQRDTESRVLHAQHLRTPRPEHAVVHMAALPDGRRFKLDGHTRDLLWQKHPELGEAVLALAGGRLIVLVYNKDEIEEVGEAYDLFDSAAALETARDIVFGSMREEQFKPQSAFIRKAAKLSAAMRFAYTVENKRRPPQRTADLHDLAAWYLPELKLLDGLDLNTSFFTSPIVTAALITLRRHRVFGAYKTTGKRIDERPASHIPVRFDRVIEFWDRYNKNVGGKIAGTATVDAVEALHRIRQEQLSERRRKQTLPYLVSRCVSCVEAYVNDRSYSLGKWNKAQVKPTKLSTYFPPDPADAEVSTNGTSSAQDLPLAAAPRE